MTTPIAPTAPDPASSPVAPITPAATETPLANQLYATAPVVEPVTSPVTPPADATANANAPTDTKPSDATPDGNTDETANAPEYIQGEDGQWRRADGTFATAEELAQIEAQIAEGEKEKAEADANRPSTVVAIRGRNGETVEIEAPDEATAQLLRQNVNDGMRKREFDSAKAEVDAMRAELEYVGKMLEANPEGLLDAMPDEVQIRILARGIARHFDALVPVIQGYDANPSSRLQAVTEAQRAIREQQGQYESLVASQRAAAEVKQAVSALIPETAADEQVSEFWHLATLKLTAAIDAQQPVNKDTVKAILAPVLKLYGFEGAAPAAPTRPRITLAKSGTATPAAPAAAPAPAAPANPQQRLRLQQQRRNAAAIPPHGRGGHAKPAAPTVDRAFQDAAHLLYGNTARA